MVDAGAIWALMEEVFDPEVPVLSVVDLGIVREVRVGESGIGQGGISEGGGGIGEGGISEGGGGGTSATGQGAGRHEGIEIVITPTYSGCPAMDVIRTNIRLKLLEHGFRDVQLTTVLSPAWTTDWMSEQGKEKLRHYGIAPPLPLQQVCHPAWFQREEAIACPHCHSYHTTMISEFGSTACKALYRCEDCREPFDYFKCH